MDRKKIGYWIATGLFCLPMLLGAFGDLIRAEALIEVMQTLRYPLYLMTILGVAKLLGVFAILMPGWPRLKEWAYAGFTFDLLGAALSHAAVKDLAQTVIVPLVILGIGAASYLLRPDDRRLPGTVDH